jgi:integrase/recombinase XerD
MGDGPALFCDEGGGRIHRGTIRNRLASLLEMEQAAAQARGGHGDPARFSPHALGHACATRNYERGVDLVAIQQMLGHWHVGTTMRYVTQVSGIASDGRGTAGRLIIVASDGRKMATGDAA